MQRQKLAILVGLACFVAAVGTVVLAQPQPGAAEVPYPDGFRRWAHVKTAVITPQNAHFKGAGGFHHIYANPLGLTGYAGGKFADGSVLAFDRLAIEDDAGVLNEGKRIVVDVMVKDAAKYQATGGWGFEEFAGSSTTERRIGANAKAACFECHARMSAHDNVVSDLRE